MITIVSGLPRSGTSMMMRMLQAGGADLLVDEKRPADENNRYGYFEYEPVKNLAQDNSWLGQAEGKTVKIIAQLLNYLPAGYCYKVIFMERAIDEALNSQMVMLRRLNRKGSSLSREQLKKVFTAQVEQTKAALQQRNNIELCQISYTDTVEHPEKTADALERFLNISLNTQRMVEAVDGNLYRQRA